MPNVVDQGCAVRQHSKGTVLYIRELAANPTFSQPCNFQAPVKLAGVISINAPKMVRSGVVDATELAPAPAALEPQRLGVFPDNNIEENYFYTAQCPGTKKIDPISLQLNLDWNQYIGLVRLYSNDAYFNAYIQFRNGRKLYFDPFVYVESMDTNIEENALVKVQVELQPTFRVLYVPETFQLPAACNAIFAAST